MDTATLRREMVRSLRQQGHLQSASVEEAMMRVPREEFVPADAREEAYLDRPLSIGQRQTISAPHMVAIMSDALEAGPGQRILEVGTGSGYQAAILSHLVGPAGSVVSIERVQELAHRAEAALRRIGATNVKLQVGDGSKGYPPHAPYDRIIVTAAAPSVPPPLPAQLADGGLLLVPVGGRTCDLMRLRRVGDTFTEESLGKCAFVPLKGEHGHRFHWIGKR